jgi:hypothetical protein
MNYQEGQVSRYWDCTHKYGILLPKSFEEALWINQETGTHFWQKAIEKEMKAIKCALEFKDDDKMPVGQQHISTKYNGSNPNDATVGSSGHATGVPKVVTKGSKIVRESVATLLGLTSKQA